MSVEYFDEQRRQLIAAIRADTNEVANRIGKTALDKRVIRAMIKVPRHEFVPAEVRPYAYANRPLPIGFGKTISQPLMVAVMTGLLELKPDDVVLEIGTGLGYQSAVLAELASGPNLTIRFAQGFPVGLACASLRNARANEHSIECDRPQRA